VRERFGEEECLGCCKNTSLADNSTLERCSKGSSNGKICLRKVLDRAAIIVVTRGELEVHLRERFGEEECLGCCKNTSLADNSTFERCVKGSSFTVRFVEGG
jgi:hypothetical protein